MTLILKFKQQGWYLTEEGLEKCCAAGSGDEKAIIKSALNLDLQQIGASILPKDLIHSEKKWVEVDCILQVAKVTNVAAPKAKADASSGRQLLRIELTDGHSALSALDMEGVKGLGPKTPPGTKIRLKGGKSVFKHNFLILNNSSVEVLGGDVESLTAKWRLCQSFVNYSCNKAADAKGPPQWVPFGQKIVDETSKVDTGKFKSLEASNKDVKDNAAFKQQRQATIDEANKAKTAQKVFGGGRQILEQEGGSLFSGDTGYNKRPMRSHDRWGREPADRTGDEAEQLDGRTRFGRKDKGRKGGRREDLDFDVAAPSKQSTLFDFLASKIDSIDFKSESNHVPASNNHGEQSSLTLGNINGRESSSAGRVSSFDNGNPPSNAARRGYTMNDRTHVPHHPSNHVARGMPSGAHLSKPNSGYPRAHVNGGDVRSFGHAPQQQHSISRPYSNNNNSSSNNGSWNSVSSYGQNSVRNTSSKTTSELPRYPGHESARGDTRDRFSGSLKAKADFSDAAVNRQRWKPGEQCLVKYWEDSKFYPAVVYAAAADGVTCVVHFPAYGNYEEVLVDDMKKFDPAQRDKRSGNAHGPSGSREYHRSRTVRSTLPNSGSAEPRMTGSSQGSSRPPIKMYVPPAQRQ